MDEHYEQFLKDSFEMGKLHEEMKSREYFKEAFQYYFHSHIDWFEKSIGSMYPGKEKKVVITGVDFKGDLGERVYINYQALIGLPWGARLKGTIPIDELRPKDHDPSLQKEKKQDRDSSKKIWP